MRPTCATSECSNALKQPWYVSTRLIQYVNQTMKKDGIPTRWLKARKSHGNLALAFIFGLVKQTLILYLSNYYLLQFELSSSLTPLMKFNLPVA